MSRDLTRYPAVALLGPRQVGKTTLARTLGKSSTGETGSTLVQRGTGNITEYLDLENPADLAKLDDASAYLRTRTDRLLVIDEVQRAPGLYNVLRGVIDERVLEGNHAGHFLLLGSASIELLKPDAAFVVYPGTDRYPKGEGVEAIGLVELCALLAEFGSRS